jgi:hypothetical protein
MRGKGKPTSKDARKNQDRRLIVLSHQLQGDMSWTKMISKLDQIEQILMDVNESGEWITQQTRVLMNGSREIRALDSMFSIKFGLFILGMHHQH